MKKPKAPPSTATGEQHGPGRPTKDEDRERLKMISFRIDDETLQILDRLEAALGDGVIARRRRSIAIRRALHEAGDRLFVKSEK